MRTPWMIVFVSMFCHQAHAGYDMVRRHLSTIIQDNSSMQESGFTVCHEDVESDLNVMPREYLVQNHRYFDKHYERETPVSVRVSLDSFRRAVWFVDGPKHANTNRLKPYVGAQLQFTPTTFGKHRLTVLVQDDQGRCSGLDTAFFVGVNRMTPARDIAIRMPQMHWRETLGIDRAHSLGLGEGLIVAVIGTGVDYLHSQLHGSMWSKECVSPSTANCEIPDNGIDDDQNGLIDDAYGWDYVDQDPYPYDYSSHETAVAAIIAAKDFGVAPKARIMNLKVSDNQLGSDLWDIAKAIRYAVDNGAKVINLSTGFFHYDSLATVEMLDDLRNAISYAESSGVVLVVSAGNGERLIARNIDQEPFYPSSFVHKNIVSVAAVDQRGKLTSYSNFGDGAVDVAAPGGEMSRSPLMVLTPEVPNSSGFMPTQGTSFSAPMVAGVIALALSARPDEYLENGKVIFSRLQKKLLSSGEWKPDLDGRVKSSRVLSAPDLLFFN